MTCPRCYGTGRESRWLTPNVRHNRDCRLCGGWGLYETGTGDA